MKLSKFYLCSLSILLTTISFDVYGGYTLQGGRLVNNQELATMSVQEHYSAAMDAYQKKDWEELIHQAMIITKNFPSTPFANESLFYLGVGYFNLREFEESNQYFSTYLKRNATPKHFEDAIQYKFSIAEKFQNGAKKRVLGWEGMPKILPAREDALNIYEEVITALPHDELAAKALFGKAKLLFKEEEFKSSVEAFQTLIRRFPKNPLAAESYIGIGEVYLTQCKKQYPDPDFLDLAEINLRKFRLDFPGEDRVVIAEKMFLDMQEVYAASLFETGQYFERTKKPHASIIYYNKVVSNYPATHAAKLSEKRLDALNLKQNGKNKKQKNTSGSSNQQKVELENQVNEQSPELSNTDSSEQAYLKAAIQAEEMETVKRTDELFAQTEKQISASDEGEQDEIQGFNSSKASLIQALQDKTDQEVDP